VPWSGLTNADMEIEANYTRTVDINVRLQSDPSKVKNVSLYHSIRVLPRSWYLSHPNAKIYGYAYDRLTGDALRDIRVDFNGAGGVQYGTFTNQSGYYEINFYAHRHVMSQQMHAYILAVMSLGHEAFLKPYWPVSGSNIRQDVYLERKSENVNCTLLKRIETNMTIYRGAVTKDERFVVFSHGHCELNLTQEEIRNLSSVLFFDTNGTLLWRYPAGGEVWGVDVSDDGSYVAAVIIQTGSLEKAILLDRNGTLLWDTSRLGNIMSREIKISHNNKYVAVGTSTLYLLNLTNGNPIWTQFLEGQIRQIEFSSDDSLIFAGSGDGYLYKIGIDGNILNRTNIEAWPYSTGGLKLTEDDTYVATASKLGNITLINANSGERLWTFDTMGGGHYVDISPNKDYVIAGSGGPFSTSLFDINGTLRWFSFGGMGSDSAMIANDGRHIVIGRDWGFDIINPNGTILWGYWENFSHIQKPTFTHFVYVNKNQTRIITAHGSGAVYFWNLSINVVPPIDETPPTIGTPIRVPEGDASPGQPVKVSVNATDTMSGVKNVTLQYTVNNRTSWTSVSMNHNASTDLYEAAIPGQPAGTLVKFKIVAYDYAGNNATRDGTEPYCTYQVIPEFPSLFILPLFMIETLLAVMVYRRKHSMLQGFYKDSSINFATSITVPVNRK